MVCAHIDRMKFHLNLFLKMLWKWVARKLKWFSSKSLSVAVWNCTVQLNPRSSRMLPISLWKCRSYSASRLQLTSSVLRLLHPYFETKITIRWSLMLLISVSFNLSYYSVWNLWNATSLRLLWTNFDLFLFLKLISTAWTRSTTRLGLLHSSLFLQSIFA